MKLLPKQKAYPKKVYLGSTSYSIVFVKTFKDRKQFGETDSATRTIRIKSGMSRRETFSTIIHELLHAMEFEHDIVISHTAVYKLEKAIVEFFFDNFT